MKKNKWVLLLIAFVAFLVLVYLYGSHLFAEEYTPEGENLMKVIPMEL